MAPARPDVRPNAAPAETEAEAEDPNRDTVTIVLVHGGRELRLGPVDRGARCGLGFIDDLLHLQLAVRRFGWSLRVDDVPVELHELLELTGLRPHLDG